MKYLLHKFFETLDVILLLLEDHDGLMIFLNNKKLIFLRKQKID